MILRRPEPRCGLYLRLYKDREKGWHFDRRDLFDTVWEGKQIWLYIEPSTYHSSIHHSGVCMSGLGSIQEPSI